MRIVLISDEVSADVVDAVAFGRAHGVHEVAIRGVAGESVLALGDPAVTALADDVASLGVPVHALLSPIFKAYPTGRSGAPLVDSNVPAFSTDISDHLAALERLPMLAARLGAACVRVFSLLRVPGAERGLPAESVELLTGLERAHPGLCAVENEDTCTVASIEELGHCALETGMAAILDPGNDWYVRREPIAPRLGARLAGRLADVHVKDMVGGVAVPVGDGEIDWTAILTRLHDLGYAGTLTLEPHLGQDREGVARSIDALQRLVAAAGG